MDFKKLTYAIACVMLVFVCTSCDELSGIFNETNENNDGEISTLTDVDGNSYQAISIGSQVWMTENLRTTTLNDGTPIRKVSIAEEWDNLETTPGYCWYDNDSLTYAVSHGAIYNWHVVHTGNVCPTGWHVPSDSEWKTLIDYVGDNGHNNAEGTALKASSGWDEYNGVSGNGTDDFGFNAVGGGMRGYLSDVPFYSINSEADYWSSTEFNTACGVAYILRSDRSDVQREYARWKVHGISIRCVKDDDK